MARVEIPDQPAGMTKSMVTNLARRRKVTPRETTEQSLDTLAMMWGAEGDKLAGLAVVAAILDEMIRTEVAELREDNWRSWSEIGASLGMSKQAAQQKYRTAVKGD